MNTREQLIKDLSKDVANDRIRLRPQNLEALCEHVLGLLFSPLAPVEITNEQQITEYLDQSYALLSDIFSQLNLGDCPWCEDQFSEILVKLRPLLKKDAEFIAKEDPAATNLYEVILSYPGLKAIALYRFAHELYLKKIPLLPRLITEFAHNETGIDIHPGAEIGHPFFIDHGTGIVIGETAIIGNFVKIFQGVTIGALSVAAKLKQTKRHPTIKDHVVIYSNASILGGETVIGEQSVIGGNVWITASVPDHTVVTHKSESQFQGALKAGKTDS